MVLFVVFATTVGYVIIKATGYNISFAIIIFFVSLIYSGGSYFFSDKIVLSTSGAKQIQKNDSPELFRIVENLSIASGLPMPKIHIINEQSPNAFATGRDPLHASIAVTTGLLEILNKSELEGVIAHELSHVKNYDIRLLAITAVLVGFIAILTDMFMRNLLWGGMNRDNDNGSRGQVFVLVIGLVLAILAPIVASLIQLAVSRKREFLADASGALLTRYPEALASALEKIASDQRPMRRASNATAHLYISNPFKKKSAANAFSGLFNTHPPAEERIKILREM